MEDIDNSDLDVIGKGGFGVVAKCTNRRNGKELAIKISTSSSFDINDQKYFLREVCAFAAINHPAAVKIVGYSLPTREFETPIILLDLIPGGTLRENLDEIKENPWFDTTEKMIIIAGITSIIAHFHANGLIHRDIKPENVLLDENHEPKLSDFGLARSYNEELDVCGTHAGTDRYMAPEGIGGSTKPLPSLDIYSLAIMIFEIIVEKHPYDLMDKVTVIKIMKGDRPKIPKFVPAPLADLIQRAWSSDPSQRPSAHEMLTLLGNEDYMLKGTDWNRYKEYYDKVYEATDPLMSHKARDLYIKCETGDFIDWYAFAKQIITENPKNPMVVKLAEKYFEKSADEKFYLAAYELGKLLIKKPDPSMKAKAVELFRIGADHLHPDSMFELAKCLKDGKGTRKNYKEATELFKKAGQFGSIDAYVEYARMIVIGGEGVPSNTEKGKGILAALYTETNDEKINKMLLAFEDDDDD